jgi:hypothetical protein
MTWVFFQLLKPANLYAAMHQDSLAGIYLHRAETGLRHWSINGIMKKSGWKPLPEKSTDIRISTLRTAGCDQNLKQYYQTQSTENLQTMYRLAKYTGLAVCRFSQWAWARILSLVPDYTGKLKISTLHIYKIVY